MEVHEDKQPRITDPTEIDNQNETKKPSEPKANDDGNQQSMAEQRSSGIGHEAVPDGEQVQSKQTQ